MGIRELSQLEARFSVIRIASMADLSIVLSNCIDEVSRRGGGDQILIVIDSLTALSNFIDLDHVATSIFELKNRFRRMGITCLMTMNSSAHTPLDMAKMQSSSSGSIALNRSDDAKYTKFHPSSIAVPVCLR